MLLIANGLRVLIVSIYPHASTDLIWCNTLTRLDPIAAGVLLAVLLRGKSPEFKTWQRIALWCAGSVILIETGKAWNTGVPRLLSPSLDLVSYPALALGCALILLSVLGLEAKIPVFLVYLGKVSYGLYLFHLLGVMLADDVLMIPGGLKRGLLRIILSLGFTVGLATLSYHFLEAPFLRMKNRFARVQSRPV